MPASDNHVYIHCGSTALIVYLLAQRNCWIDSASGRDTLHITHSSTLQDRDVECTVMLFLCGNTPLFKHVKFDDSIVVIHNALLPVFSHIQCIVNQRRYVATKVQNM